MQARAIEVEREAANLLPGLLGELLRDGDVRLEATQPPVGGTWADLSLRDSRERLWLVEIKSSSQPGHVKTVAGQLARIALEGDGTPILMVPHMSPGGAKTAAEEGINWIDFAGNADIEEGDLRIRVEGRERVDRRRGRPASPFAPRSARVARQLLLDPGCWWRQRDLAAVTGLNDGTVSRVVHSLNEALLLEYDGNAVRPRDPGLLLDAWADDYRFDKHDIVVGHLTGSGIELARVIAKGLSDSGIIHAFSGLPAAWVVDSFAQFRLATVYVDGDPRVAAEALGLRRHEKGMNVQLVGPNDRGVCDGHQLRGQLKCVSIVQTYLDLLHLPERAGEAAAHLRAEHLDWNGAQR